MIFLLVLQIIDKELSNTGVVISVGCGVVTLQGFLLAYVGELFKVCSYSASQDNLGIVVNLYRDSTLTLIIVALLINPANRISEGAQVIGQCTLSSIIIGDYAIGSILDALGNLILNSRISCQRESMFNTVGLLSLQHRGSSIGNLSSNHYKLVFFLLIQ